MLSCRIVFVLPFRHACPSEEEHVRAQHIQNACTPYHCTHCFIAYTQACQKLPRRSDDLKPSLPILVPVRAYWWWWSC